MIYDKKRLPDLLTGEEVLEVLRLDPKDPVSCLGRLRRMGVLKGIRIGRAFRYTREEVLRLMEGRA